MPIGGIVMEVEVSSDPQRIIRYSESVGDFF